MVSHDLPGLVPLSYYILAKLVFFLDPLKELKVLGVLNLLFSLVEKIFLHSLCSNNS